MFSTFKILVIYLIIPSRCANIPLPSGEKTTLSFEEQVKKELSPIKDSLKHILDPSTHNDEKLELKGVIQGEVKKIIERAVNAEIENKMLIKNQGVLENEKKRYKGLKIKLLYRQTIEDIEDGFPKDTDDDFETKKVVFDKSILKTKVGFDYNEERRRQKWVHYAKNLPNKLMEKIVEQAKTTGLDEEQLASGVAKAHRRLSEDIHKKNGDVESIQDPVKYFYSKSVVLSLRVVLREADIIEDYLPSTDVSDLLSKKNI